MERSRPLEKLHFYRLAFIVLDDTLYITAGRKQPFFSQLKALCTTDLSSKYSDVIMAQKFMGVTRHLLSCV